MSLEPKVSELAARWRLENSYAELPQGFFQEVMPTPVKAPRLVVMNEPVAEMLGLDAAALRTPQGAELFAGNTVPAGARPIAQAYSGHQYGHFTTLGDGRAILLGEQLTPEGRRFDVQLKGAGPTPYSRRGDGRAALGPMLREYVISEAMFSLGIPTTRALAVVATGETVWRQEGLPGAVLTRVASSHIRVGTFEGAAARRDAVALQALVDYTLKRHYPERVGSENGALALLEGVIERQARLIAQWMHVGFIHGVMNTDNMALSGETIDYGPCAFMDAYSPATVFSSIDERGRYSYGNQPAIAQWNLARLAEALLDLIAPVEAVAVEKATSVLNQFGVSFQAEMLGGFRRKLGLFNEEADDIGLVEGLLGWMQAGKLDFTNTFAALATGAGASLANAQAAPKIEKWLERWAQRLGRQSQTPAESETLRRGHCPAVIPRNHLVEEALRAAELGELGSLERLVTVLRQPYAHGTHPSEYTMPGEAGDEPYQTFCGT